MNMVKVVAIAMTILVASLSFTGAVSAGTIFFQGTSSNAPQIISFNSQIFSDENGRFILTYLTVAGTDTDFFTCTYSITTSAGTITKPPFVCLNNEAMGEGFDIGPGGCLDNEICIIKAKVSDNQGRSDEKTATIDLTSGTGTGTGSGTGTGTGTAQNSITVEELGTSRTGLLSVSARGAAATGIEYIDIYVGINGQNPNRVKHCDPVLSTPPLSNPLAFGCQHHDTTTYQVQTAITYYAKMKVKNNANEIESDHKKLTVQNAVVDQTANQIQCYQACSANPSGTRIPYGYCNADGAVPAGMQAQMNSLGIVVGPVRNPAGVCPVNEYCWCIYVDVQNGLNQFGAQCDRFVAERAPTSWDDPDKMDPAPKKTLSPPPYACDAGTDANIVANISQARVETGSLVTVSGYVGKITEKCNGYEYTCRQQAVLDCEVNDGFFQIEQKYKDCPSGYKNIHEEGAKKKFKWGTLLYLIGQLCTLGQSIYGAATAKKGTETKTATPGSTGTSGTQTGGGAPPDSTYVPTSGGGGTGLGDLFGALGQLGTALGSGVGAIYTALSYGINALASGAGELLDSPIPGTGNDPLPFNEPPPLLAKGPESENRITGHFPWLIVIMASCTAINTAATFVCNRGPSTLPECYRVCAKDSVTESSPTYDSVCPLSPNKYVISAEEDLYDCAASPKTTCGGYANKDVNIKIRNSAGDIDSEVNVYTTSEGIFDYTFRAPYTEGRYNAIVTVPGGI